MKRTLIALIPLFSLALACGAHGASVPVPAPPKLDARSYVLIDHHSGRVLAERSPDERLEPASITKLMTAYAVFDAIRAGKLKLDDAVTISERAWRAEGSRTFLEVGKQVPVEVLIQGMIVQSGNDATIALAERVGGTEETFASLMNEYAKRLGMTNSHFENSSGLPSPTHYMSARDIATLSSAIVREFPAYYRWYSQREFTWNNIRQENRNGLLDRDPSVDGIKTGFTETAGYCLVTSAKRDDMRLISVVLGTPSEKARETSSQALLNYGFSFFETRKLHDAGTSLQQVEVWKAAESPVDAGLRHPLHVTVPRGELGAVKSVITVEPKLIAPLATTAKVAELRVQLGDELLATRPLHPLKAVAEGGLWTRIIDSVLLWFE
ncbi:MAG TPA: D-alanyl-D-alanine carboxypeptidase family protein [Steroidobacteraceae bacterium]